MPTTTSRPTTNDLTMEQAALFLATTGIVAEPMAHGYWKLTERGRMPRTVTTDHLIHLAKLKGFNPTPAPPTISQMLEHAVRTHQLSKEHTL